MRFGAVVLAVGLAALGVWLLLDTESGEDGPLDGLTDPGATGPGGPGLQARGDPGTGPEGPTPGAIDPAPEDPIDSSPGGVRVRGRVVDARRRPVVGARVEIGFRGRAPHRGETDAEGYYELAVGARPARFEFGLVQARSKDGRVARGPVALSRTSPDVLRLGALVVRPGQDLDVHVQYAGAPVAGAEVALVARIWSRMTPLTAGRTDAGGTFRATGLPAGSLWVFAAGDGRGRGRTVVRLPRVLATPVVVELGEPRDVTVTVVDATSGLPVEGAVVEVGDRFTATTGDPLQLFPPLDPLVTDAEGRVRVRGLASDGPYFVAAHAEGYAQPNPYLGGGHTRVPTDADEVTIKLGRHRSIRFPIRAGRTERPDADTPLDLQVQTWLRHLLAPDASARVEDGEVVIRGLPASWLNGRVVTPDGRFAQFTARMNAPRGDALVFQSPVSARVRLVEVGGKPLAGERVVWRGGFSFGNQTPEVTNARGEAVLRGMSLGRIQVHLLSPGESFGGLRIGQIELTSANVADVHELEVVRAHDLTIQVTLDGEPGLPPSYRLRVGPRSPGPDQLTEDPERGLLRVRLRTAADGTPIPVILEAEGYVPRRVVHRVGDARPLAVELTPAGLLIASVQPPADGELRLQLERMDAQTGQWTYVPYGRSGPGGARPRTRELTEVAFDVPEPGRYRVFDSVSRMRSEPVDVRLGVESFVVLDLSASIWARVQVTGPDGERVRHAWVSEAGDPTRRYPVDARGRAQLRASRGAELVVTAHHPVLTAAADSRDVRVTAGATAPTRLTLVASTQLTFQLAGVPKGGYQRAAAITLFDSEGAEVFRRTSLFQGGAHTIGGYPTGTYTLWIDPHVGTPVEVGPRVLGPGSTALGLLARPEGHTAVVAVPKTAARVFVRVRRLDGRPYERTGLRLAEGKGPIRVTGLLPGRHAVQVEIRGIAKPLTKEVVIGASGETTVTFE